MKTSNTVESFSQRAAEDFIQTAVFVDDRLYERQSKDLSKLQKVMVPKTRKKATKSAQKSIPAPASTVLPAEDSTPDAYDIVHSFAKKQIVCSLYQPKRDAKVSPNSEIFPLCRAADIVIVDWDLYGDSGDRALELIDGLISQAIQSVPEQLRLILVYTQDVNLFSIANKLFERVSQSIGEDFKPQAEDGGLAFHTANSRVVVLGKPGRARIKDHEKFVVSEADLADVAVREFAKLASGLLHAASLLGLSEIRKNSRKILSKFNKELDPAFLAHLAMSLPHEDASHHIIPLLVSEIEAVLQDALPDPFMSNSLYEDWCCNIWEPGQHTAGFLNDKDDIREVGKSVLLNGFEHSRQNSYNKLPKTNNNSNIRKASKLFLKDNSDLANHRFAHLMSSRTFYGNVGRALSLGTIIFDQKNQNYLLCLQPLCDAVRIENTQNFVFSELSIEKEVGEGRATHVAIKPNGDVLELLFSPKSFSFRIIEFKSNSGSGPAAGKVQSLLNEQGNYEFSSVDGTKFDWIDQLKPSHAQRAVEALASDLSRVGLTESEWLRGLNKK